MGKAAVDVVVLPDSVVAEWAIEANRRLVERFGDRIVLDGEKCLPHVSLAMGCVDEGAVREVEVVLQRLAREYRLGVLEVAGVVVSTNSIGEKVTLLEVERSEQLQRLHEAVMEELGRYFNGDATRAMMYAGHEVEESSLMWIRNYRAKSSFEHFFPHITIGYGEVEMGGFPMELRPSQLALCHLGNHCTCRKVLAAVEL